MLRWEILEIIEQNGQVTHTALYRPLGQPDGIDAYRLPFGAGANAHQLISAVLFDGFEPLSQAVIVLPDGSVQKHWTFRLQVIT